MLARANDHNYFDFTIQLTVDKVIESELLGALYRKGTQVQDFKFLGLVQLALGHFGQAVCFHANQFDAYSQDRCTRLELLVP